MKMLILIYNDNRESMAATMKILEHGKITIPKKLRDRYGLKPDTELDVLPLEEGIMIVKKSAKKSHIRDVYGILKKNQSSNALVDEIRGAQTVF